MGKLKAEEIKLVSKDKVAGIQDDEYFQISNEFDQIRSSLGMYISSGGNAGALHLLKELLNNCLDEANNGNPHWKHRKKKIGVEFYQSMMKFVVSDNGRGIPSDILVSAVMHKHTSTKTIGVSQVRNKKQAGMNGVGLTVTAALTDYMAVTTNRGNYSKTIELIDGELRELPVVNLKSERTGTVVSIVPSESYLGPLNVTTDMVEDYIRNMSYLIDPDVEITFVGEKDSDSSNIEYFTKTYKAQGLSAAVKYLSSSLEFPPVEVKFCCDDYDITLAFSYDRTLDDNAVASFCNYVVTTEGGVHEVAAMRAICDFFSKEARKLDPTAKNEVSFDDCKRGLVMAVNLEHVEPKFEGQHKTRVSNMEIVTPAKRGLYEALTEAMNNNQGLLRKIVGYLRQIAKARYESHKIRGVSVKKKTTFLEDSEIRSFIQVKNRNSTHYRELFICEGISSGGAINNCRNPEYQAIYTIQGVTDNIYGLTVHDVLNLKSRIFAELIQILGCGIGNEFNIQNLRYQKIIICTDSDADGYYIASLIMCFFFIFMPELVREGYIYRAAPPLYLMDLKSLRRFYKGREWLYDKLEYYQMLNTIIADNCEFYLEAAPASKKKAPELIAFPSKKATIDWLSMNSEYKLELDNLGKKTACENISLLETVCYYKPRCKTQTEFKRKIEAEFPEMNYSVENQSIMGSWNRQRFSLICDSLFDKAAQRFMDELNRNEYMHVWYRNRNNPNDQLTRATIGEFLTAMDQMFNVKIEQRFKGNGEADAELLFKTVANPKFRRLIRLQIGDFERAVEVFELMHRKNDKCRRARNELVRSTKMSYADIDN